MSAGAGEVDDPLPAVTVELAAHLQSRGVGDKKSVEEVASVIAIAIADATGGSINAVSKQSGTYHFLAGNIIREARWLRATGAEPEPDDAEQRRATAAVIVAAGYSPLSVNQTAAVLAEAERSRAAGKPPNPYAIARGYDLRDTVAAILTVAESLQQAIPESAATRSRPKLARRRADLTNAAG
jgi:hypothetical protein